MKNAFIASIILHVVLLLASSMNLSISSKSINTPNTMVFDYVKIGDKTAAPKLAPVEKKKEEKKAEKKEEIKKKEDLPPPQPTESLMNQKEPEPQEDPKKDQKPEEKKAEKKKPGDTIPIKQKKPQPKKVEKKPEVKQKNKKAEHNNKNKQNKQKNAQTKAQVNLKKNKSNAKKQKDDPKKTAKALNDLLLDADNESSDNEDSARTDQIADVFTASRIDAIKSTIKKCWIIPAGLAKEMVVDLKMQLTEDGTVVKAEVTDQGRMNNDPDFRLAAEAARRAVLDPECNPLPMPKENYSEWKNLELEFDPKDMF